MAQDGGYIYSNHGITSTTNTNANTDTNTNTATSRVIHILGYEYQRDLVIARVFYIFYFASFGSLFPLLAIYFKQLGMNASQAGILLGTRPLVEFAARPFWSSFANKFRKGKLLLEFSLASFIVSTLAIGFVQPLTPYCVVKPINVTTKCFYLEPAGQIIQGGALGYLKKATEIGRKKRDTSPILETIIDLSSYNKEDDVVPGLSPLALTKDKVCNYDEDLYGVLVSPPHSTRVYRKPAVEQVFLLLLLLVILGEFFSSPSLALADSVTLTYVSDNPKQFGIIRLFGSFGWGLAMFIMGIGLDYSETFRNHPCPTKNTTEKNYTLCFIAYSLFMLLQCLLFRFGNEQRPDEAACTVIETRIDEIAPAVAEKARVRQLQLDHSEGNAQWIPTIKALFRGHAAFYLLAVTTIGFGAGIIFAFLFWHLQDFGGSPILFGFASVVNHGTEIAAHFYCFQLINKFGHIKLINICLLANVIRFFIISLLTNPWMVLPLQALQGLTLATTWASASSYISLIAPSQLKRTAQTLLMLLYHGIGKGFGSIIGGCIIKSAGTRLTFQIYSIIAVIILSIHYGMNRLFKYDDIKYSHEFDDDDDMPVAPQGLPLHHGESKLTDAFNQTSVINANYGTIETKDPTQEAYDRYVKLPPVNNM
ncbi:major facilitator superfamily transporter domain-containing protein 6 [Loa loa]|uniref:Major facilitator superfamily transporter domain-containing protein 6 n=1 Tax=Loa loa TaxID=7209 RepID=A0A1S0UIR5_LOALO|nr:major facilitator superfamily transporter domain-containing protein 6 [Loa loa]EJD75580.1 major facilitator superfamily transporter domain-containing protein 6 [Loa loa]